LAFLENVAARSVKAAIHLLQFILALNLDPQVVEPWPTAPRGNGEVYPRIIKHPLGVIGLL
jgi:hypothetical protein